MLQSIVCWGSRFEAAKNGEEYLRLLSLNAGHNVLRIQRTKALLQNVADTAYEFYSMQN